jgi:hypothetical protein
MSDTPTPSYVEVPENWLEMSEEEQDAFIDALIRNLVPET